MPSETYDAVENFLRDVDDQISCKLGLDSVNEELRAHIEDKMELYQEYGLDGDEACRRAIRDMGAPDVVGLELNQSHRLRTAKPLLFVILALMLAGFAGELLRLGVSWNQGIYWTLADTISDVLYLKYYFWGLLALFVTARFGYPFLLKHTKGVCIVSMAALAAVGGFWILSGLFPGVLDKIMSNAPYFVHRLQGAVFNSSIFVGAVQLAVPVGAILLYRRRKDGYRGFVLLFFWQIFLVLLSGRNFWSESTYIPVLLLLLACLGISLYLSARGEFRIPKGRGMALSVLSFCVLLALWAAPKWDRVKENLELCVNPDARASVTTAWDDSYNNVLIRELLGRARAFGKIDLTDEELVRYGTARWYYEDGPGNWNDGRETASVFDSLERHVETRMQHLDEPALRDILPQHYMENYRASWWILRYGWVPALALMLLVAALPALALWTAFRIRNGLGRLVSFSAGLLFALQTAVYLLEGLGFQFGGFPNLPFVAEGTISITGSAVLAGLILSAYRFDTVLEEKKEPGATSSGSGR